MTRPLWAYVSTAYGITWAIILGLYALHMRGTITRDELNLYFNFGALGPSLGATIAASLFYGRKGLRSLFATLSPSRLDRRSLLLALSPLLLFAIGWLVHLLLTGTPFSFETTKREFGLTTTASYLGWAMPFFTYALFEEIGWRGFALPHLQERHSALTSTAILAVIWGAVACSYVPVSIRFQHRDRHRLFLQPICRRDHPYLYLQPQPGEYAGGDHLSRREQHRIGLR
jgi:uncharacterized protein